MNLDEQVPSLPIGDWARQGIDWLTDNAGGLFQLFRDVMTWVNDTVVDLLLTPQAVVLTLILALLGWLVRSPWFAIGTVITFLLIIGMGLWVEAMQLLALVLIATLLAVVMAVPLGILAARNRAVSAVLKPVLDFMQTMPAFVYLIPAVTFFSIGVVPGIFATVIFALPPGVRLTELGIRQVDRETIEAGKSFGASGRQLLWGIQFPLALPTIMAGINQVIMLALSMAVIAGMVGADGLGKEVVGSIANLNTARGVEAGLSVVILAIYLDRLTSALGAPASYPRSLISLLRGRRGRPQSEAADEPEAEAAPDQRELASTHH
jgi:glycine betaine/proline transport system permease protein